MPGIFPRSQTILDRLPHGIFATRAPKRPNAIGLSIVRLVGIQGNLIEIEDVDILDGTPVLDIKPYVPAFDSYGEVKAGWFDGVSHNAASVRSDEIQVRYHLPQN